MYQRALCVRMTEAPQNAVRALTLGFASKRFDELGIGYNSIDVGHRGTCAGSISMRSLSCITFARPCTAAIASVLYLSACSNAANSTGCAFSCCASHTARAEIASELGTGSD